MEKYVNNRRNRCRLILSKISAILIAIMLIVPVMPVYATEEVTGDPPGREIEEVSGEMSDRLRFVDLAGLVGEGITGEIEEKLREISTRQKMDVVIVTTNSLDGKTATEYADDFYDNVGYGYGEERDGILLLVSMEERDWAISTTGWGITVFTDAGLQYMQEQFLPYLSDGEYVEAFDTFVELCDDFITHAYEGDPYDVDALPKTYFKVIWIPIGLVAGFLISAIVACVKMNTEMKTVVKQHSASRYTKDGSMNITNSNDIYINNVVTRRTIKSDNDSHGGGGSSTHTSSSGSSHGGSSGKF